jgi:putative flippase GtrA
LKAAPVVERVGRFALVGVANTAVHVAIALSLVAGLHASQTVANVVAFCVATAFSYFANAWWTFGAAPRASSFVRFVVVALVGLATTAAVASAAGTWDAPPLVGIAAVILTVTPVTFAAHQLWTFRAAGGERAD